MFDPVYIGVIVIGLLSGVEPGYGWTVVVPYSMKKRTPVLSATLSSGISGMGYRLSSIAVVVAYVLLQAWLDFEAPWIKYLAAGILLVLAVKLFREKADGLEKQLGVSKSMTLRPKLVCYEKYVLKISAVILVVLAIVIIFW